MNIVRDVASRLLCIPLQMVSSAITFSGHKISNIFTAQAGRSRRQRRRGGVVWGRMSPSHWGWGLCPLLKNFLDFWYQNGELLCILGPGWYYLPFSCLFCTHNMN